MTQQAALSVLQCFSPEETSVSYHATQSFFNTSFAQCSKYAKQVTKLEHYGKEIFGGELDFPLNKRDMIGRVYIVWILPAIRHHTEKLRENVNSEYCQFVNINEKDCGGDDDDSDEYDYDRRHKYDSSTSSISCSSSSSSSSC